METDTTETLTWEEQMEINERKRKERIKNIVNDLFDELNKMGNEEKVGEHFIEAIRYQHRTLQQNFFGHVVLPVIKDFAKRFDEGNYDMRNEASCSTAKKIEPVIKDVNRLPFI
jgi:hypothetical protein